MSSLPLDLTPSKKSSWHHGNLREEMVRRGLELLELRGAADLSLREVARLAGVSQTAPMHHFGDKEGMLAAIASEGFRQLMAERLAALKDRMTKEERLRVVMRAYIAFALRRPELFHLMFGTRIADKTRHPELMDASGASFQFLGNSIAEFMADQSDADRPPRFSAIAVWSGMHGLATLLSDRKSGLCQVPDEKIDEVSRSVSDVLLGGLLSPHTGTVASVRKKGAREKGNV
ncbi:TetR/AcrR family transcriptional regulator [Paraburkholderia caribensis]|uniref:TetR/AcrR family transcriptional regulator n=1 Tax=Paraburkholderia TaxID=1822464 RepID=UPI001CC488B3|nr:TetR/AcrR family transcriptional regulator [Paraburkholderia caribensis]BEU25697.1 TetR/AcrR family transcriptional regulator [Paraburkholderia sp. 22B1P]